MRGRLIRLDSMDCKKIDFENTLFVIDGIMTAFIVSIIANSNKINCIFELKNGYESLESIFDLLCAGKNITVLNRYFLPHRYYLIDKSKPLKSFRALRSFSNDLSIVPTDNFKFYAGATTSSIMSMIYPEDRKIYIDHGTNNYYDRKYKSEPSLRNSLFYVIGKLLHTPNLYFSKFNKGFTLCKMKTDNFVHIDYRDFNSAALVDHLSGLIETTSKFKANVLVLPTSSWHNKDGISGDTIAYDEINIAMIERNTSKDEVLYIKYHPSLRYANNIKIELMSKLRALGYTVFNIEDLVKDGLGLLIPAEALIRYCSFNKVLSEESALLWNIAHNEELAVISEADLFEKYFNEKRSLEFVTKLNPLVSRPIISRAA